MYFKKYLLVYLLLFVDIISIIVQLFLKSVYKLYILHHRSLSLVVEVALPNQLLICYHHRHGSFALKDVYLGKGMSISR